MSDRILVIGGAGAVGREVVRALAAQPGVTAVVGGRDAGRARRMATEIEAATGAGTTESRVADATDRASVEAALGGVAVVVNCFAGPFTGAPLAVPEAAIARGVHAIDVSGSWEYSERVLGLHEAAARRGVTLITALGANPCLPALLFAATRDAFDEVESGELFFVMTEGLAEVFSVASLRELDQMLRVEPKVFEDGGWRPPRGSSLKRLVGPPLDRSVYFGPLLTRDMLALPAVTGARRIAAFSGSAGALEGIVFWLGLKLGLGRTDRGAASLLRVLRLLAPPGRRPGVVLEIVVAGTRGGTRLERTISLHGDEVRVTALVPAAAALEISAGCANRRGAYVGPDALPLASFFRRLSSLGLSARESVRELPGPAERGKN